MAAVAQARDLGLGGRDHADTRIVAIDRVEVVEVAAGRAEDQDPGQDPAPLTAYPPASRAFTAGPGSMVVRRSETSRSPDGRPSVIRPPIRIPVDSTTSTISPSPA